MGIKTQKMSSPLSLPYIWLTLSPFQSAFTGHTSCCELNVKDPDRPLPWRSTLASGGGAQGQCTPTAGLPPKYTPADPRQEMIVLCLFHLWSGSEDLTLKESSFHVIWKQVSRVTFYCYILILNFWLLSQPSRVCVKLSKFENLPHKNIKWQFHLKILTSQI